MSDGEVKAFLSDAQVLMARIPDIKRVVKVPPQQGPMGLHSDAPQSGAGKYHGPIAEGYDAKREDQPKWQAENRIVREMLSDLPRGTSVLDCPVGTGRFIPLYEELGFHALGLDLSDDMLCEASQKAKAATTYLRFGDARQLDVTDRSYDVAVCIRLMRWLESKEMQLKVISELMRVARKRVIFNVRTETGPLPLPLDEIKAWLPPWVTVARTEQIVDDFTMVMLEHAPAPLSSTDKLGVKT